MHSSISRWSFSFCFSRILSSRTWLPNCRLYGVKSRVSVYVKVTELLSDVHLCWASSMVRLGMLSWLKRLSIAMMNSSYIKLDLVNTSSSSRGLMIWMIIGGKDFRFREWYWSWLLESGPSKLKIAVNRSSLVLLARMQDVGLGVWTFSGLFCFTSLFSALKQFGGRLPDRVLDTEFCLCDLVDWRSWFELDLLSPLYFLILGLKGHCTFCLVISYIISPCFWILACRLCASWYSLLKELWPSWGLSLRISEELYRSYLGLIVGLKE